MAVRNAPFRLLPGIYGKPSLADLDVPDNQQLVQDVAVFFMLRHLANPLIRILVAWPG